MGGGGNFIMGDGKFLKSFQIVGRGVLNRLFFEDSLYCLPPFFNFFPLYFYGKNLTPTPPLPFLKNFENPTSLYEGTFFISN